MSQHKIFKEEVVREWLEGNANYHSFVDEDGEYDGYQVTLDGVFDLHKLLDLYKQKILEALPKKGMSQGFNRCLSEVKQIIENI